jgi:hypothetical protein
MVLMGPPMQKGLPEDGLIERKKLPAYCSSTLTRGLTRVHLAHPLNIIPSIGCIASLLYCLNKQALTNNLQGHL